jgi:hypothetical protein
MHATCPVSLILIDFIALLIFYEEHGLWNCLLCNCLRLLVTFSILGPNITHTNIYMYLICRLYSSSRTQLSTNSPPFQLRMETSQNTRRRTKSRNPVILIVRSLDSGKSVCDTPDGINQDQTKYVERITGFKALKNHWKLYLIVYNKTNRIIMNNIKITIVLILMVRVGIDFGTL